MPSTLQPCIPSCTNPWIKGSSCSNYTSLIFRAKMHRLLDNLGVSLDQNDAAAGSALHAQAIAEPSLLRESLFTILLLISSCTLLCHPKSMPPILLLLAVSQETLRLSAQQRCSHRMPSAHPAHYWISAHDLSPLAARSAYGPCPVTPPCHRHTSSDVPAHITQHHITVHDSSPGQRASPKVGPFGHLGSATHRCT